MNVKQQKACNVINLKK